MNDNSYPKLEKGKVESERYSPTTLINFILKEVGSDVCSSMRRVRVLSPSCDGYQLFREHGQCEAFGDREQIYRYAIDKYISTA